ncbi:hypothetical protein [Coriobacterium glomerans]|nr:hypothetical protein [Coriobacterium glomerans]
MRVPCETIWQTFYVHVHLVTGVNVPCALELISAIEPLTPEIIRRAIARGRKGLAYVNELVASVGTEDE